MKDGFAFGVRHMAYNAELRKRREELKLTQQELGAILGFNKSTISQIETFRFYPTDEQKIAISDFFNVDEEVLFPEWMRPFKLKRSSYNTEHIVTERLLPSIVDNLLLADNSKSVETKIDQEFLHKNVQGILNSLSDREAKVIKMRFGLGEHDLPLDDDKIDTKYGKKYPNGMTLEQVAQHFGVNRERIRQIEAKALRKLRHPARERKLEDFMG